MIVKSLILCVILTIAATSAHRIQSERPSFSAGLTNAGLITDGISSAADDQLCTNVSMSRELRYGEHEQNVLDVASSSENPQLLRPVLLFVMGESFTGDSTSAEWELRQKIMCLSARNGLVGVTMSYRRAPTHDWPAAARDIAAAISWVNENIDLFGGDARAIVVVGYSIGAFHLATFLAHKEFRVADSNVAGAVLLSGIYSSGAEADEDERAYLGADSSLYDARSAFPGILKIEQPIVLAWSTVDPPRVIAQAENLRESLCSAGHCPRTALLTSRDSPALVFEFAGTDDCLAERVRDLIKQIETRSLWIRSD